jgi:hypothetical protein
MVQHRNVRWRPLALIVLVALIASGAFGVSVAGNTGDGTSTPETVQEATPVSQATTDDVVFGLVQWGNDDSGHFVVEVQIRNDGSLPVRLEAQLISLTIEIDDRATEKRDLLRSVPTLPCSLEPNEHLTVRFAFKIDSNETPVEVSIGIAEVNRSGARVIFPLQPGAGASAIGGNGIPGNDAGSSWATPSAASVTPEANAASPVTGGCQH